MKMMLRLISLLMLTSVMTAQTCDPFFDYRTQSGVRGNVKQVEFSYTFNRFFRSPEVSLRSLENHFDSGVAGFSRDGSLNLICLPIITDSVAGDLTNKDCVRLSYDSLDRAKKKGLRCIQPLANAVSATRMASVSVNSTMLFVGVGDELGPQYIFRYTEDENGRVTREQSLRLWEGFSQPGGEVVRTTDFFYDDQGRLIRFFAQREGEHSKPEILFQLFTMGCDSAEVVYTYDAAGRIGSLTASSCNGMKNIETYSYDGSGRLVQSQSVVSNGRWFPGKTVTFDSFYNEHGDLVRQHLSSDRARPDGTIGNTEEMYKPDRFYEYDYDSHGNWVTCRMFLDGTNAGTPSIVATRTIEYYQD